MLSDLFWTQEFVSHQLCPYNYCNTPHSVVSWKPNANPINCIVSANAWRAEFHCPPFAISVNSVNASYSAIILAVMDFEQRFALEWMMPGMVIRIRHRACILYVECILFNDSFSPRTPVDRSVSYVWSSHVTAPRER